MDGDDIGDNDNHHDDDHCLNDDDDDDDRPNQDEDASVYWEVEK